MSKTYRAGVSGVEIIDPRTLSEAQAEAVAAIKAEAERRILSIAAVYQQLNATRRAIELLDIRTTRAWTAPEAAEAAALRTMGATIKAIRTASDVAEAGVLAAKTNDDVDNFRPVWPA